MSKSAMSSGRLRLACAVALGVAAAPAFGQEPAGAFTVVGHGHAPHERSLTAAVLYGDLDLTTTAGQAALRRRVRRTASELCAGLGGGPENATGLAFVCEDEAVQGAAEWQRAAIARVGPTTIATVSPRVAPAR